MGFSEGEFVLALINLQRGSYIEEERTGIPASYALTEKGLKWLNANFQDLIHDDR
jgi:DNA-binding PadR family transcriptional regulator